MTWNPPAMPTRADLENREWLRGGIRKAVLELHFHGINPDRIPAQDDALTEEGFLQVLGVDTDAEELRCERIPWDAAGIGPKEAAWIRAEAAKGPRDW